MVKCFGFLVKLCENQKVPKMLIVVPVDDCEASKEAIKYAKELNEKLKTENQIILLHITALNPKSKIPGL